MPKKKSENIKLIIPAVLIIGCILYLGIPYFNKFQERKLTLPNSETITPQNSETETQTSMVEEDRSISTDTGIKGNKIPINDNTVKPDKITIDDKAVKTKIIVDDKAVKTEIIVDDKTVKPEITVDDRPVKPEIFIDDKAVKTEIIVDDKGVKINKIANGNKSVQSNEIVQGRIIVLPDISYKNLKIDEKLKQLMVSRKTELGLKKSLDMIVNSNETFKVGDVQISMRDILEKATIKEGNVFQEKIETSGAVQPEQIKKFGIYVVQPGDNIWNIHFNILKEYYEHQGIKISPVADEPINRGMSSGIGKILKFSENIVIIYNLLEKKIVSNINLIEPLSKIIIYNMEEVFSVLKEIDYHNIDRIQFDGKTIWVPTKKI